MRARTSAERARPSLVHAPLRRSDPLTIAAIPPVRRHRNLGTPLFTRHEDGLSRHHSREVTLRCGAERLQLACSGPEMTLGSPSSWPKSQGVPGSISSPQVLGCLLGIPPRRVLWGGWGSLPLGAAPFTSQPRLSCPAPQLRTAGGETATSSIATSGPGPGSTSTRSVTRASRPSASTTHPRARGSEIPREPTGCELASR